MVNYTLYSGMIYTIIYHSNIMTIYRAAYSYWKWHLNIYAKDVTIRIIYPKGTAFGEQNDLMYT